ncbi:hypothetical protein PanWU01x14_286450 [Parasponia andersonii]|uniref:Zinc knuckle CX2CX4HX4C n=1 Tax=Parasponia andersonii TaxID=3476 RepID=A0A2P5AZ49_PARAD|nr:hypothetical protein PanWU01x14_286450 [Parasponia andersonii]
MLREFMRFKIDIRLDKPIQAGFSTLDACGGVSWAYMKYERQPVICYRCGVMGLEEETCSKQRQKIMSKDGKSVDLFGPWLRLGSKTEHCFSATEEICLLWKAIKAFTDDSESDLDGTETHVEPSSKEHHKTAGNMHSTTGLPTRIIAGVGNPNIGTRDSPGIVGVGTEPSIVLGQLAQEPKYSSTHDSSGTENVGTTQTL